MDLHQETRRNPPNCGAAWRAQPARVRLRRGGDDRSHSDVDLLVEMDSDPSLLDIVGLGHEFEKLLDRRVDVLTGASLHPALRDRIMAESRPL